MSSQAIDHGGRVQQPALTLAVGATRPPGSSRAAGALGAAGGSSTSCSSGQPRAIRTPTLLQLLVEEEEQAEEDRHGAVA